MDDREWQTGIYNPGEENSTEADGPVENSSPDGWQNAGQGWSGYEGEGVDPQQGGGQYRDENPYQNGAPYQNAGQYQNNGQYQNGKSGYFPHSPYQGAPLRPDGRVDGPEEPISVSEWFITMLVLAIPCVNLIMLFVWGFGGAEKRSKSNYCKACLIWMAICFVICVLFYIVVIAGIVAGMS